MSDISKLEPQRLWRWFDTICQIPHPSKHEDALAAHIVSWAQSRQLDVSRDSVGNIRIAKPATAGMESRAGVIMQAHLDMVPQKTDDSHHDFTTDPILPYVDGEWVTATQTTLGADNGMGMAACLAVLESDDIAHGPLEVLLTIDEEAGMTGAFGLQSGWLQGEYLLNTDSEQEGEIYMGCAGGEDALITLPITWQTAPADTTHLRIEISGLKGGHSGCDIDTGRANANQLLARLLSKAQNQFDFEISALSGGTLRNAIPRQAEVILHSKQSLADWQSFVSAFEAELKAHLGHTETGLQCTLESSDAAKQTLTAASQIRLISLLMAAPNGVMRMSDVIHGVVETSLNLGIVRLESDHASLCFLIRALLDEGKEMVKHQLTSLASLSESDIAFAGSYPGWAPDDQSPLMHLVKACYVDAYGFEPKINVIHAGLECGLFKQPYPHLDMISYGPTIKFPHSPDEKVEIASVAKFWQQTQLILANIPQAK
ncbi:Cytosol non-specific dipeptidase [Vibrio stylophorae]|uniref:Cytosol non-specific dipeptidase n=1 Tax=Vibrio stylophorae TaxID=659351 RepID=A0ABM8ZUP4_9VIBR|nr:aminoacyl-histidine dipeptidase [Vibrio stylophorae]CAH0534051.1 Cytosol non-specific dipeptidase [Vibrio stylophorae]